MFTAPGRCPAANSSGGRTSRPVTRLFFARSSSSRAGIGSRPSEWGPPWLWGPALADEAGAGEQEAIRGTIAKGARRAGHEGA